MNPFNREIKSFDRRNRYSIDKPEEQQVFIKKASSLKKPVLKPLIE